MQEFLSNLVLLNPQGAVGVAERGLMIQATLFMLIVAVPVFVLIFFFAWYYRAGNKKAKYTPDWAHSNMEELIWWAIPLEIVLVLGALTWSSTHALDPKRPLSDTPPIVIEAVALDWKWLFIYPEQNIATINEVVFPAGTPIRFKITADAPMNSFWIPALGGQIYAMTGMVTELNLIADREGEFAGRSANYSGEGFAKMNFIAKAVVDEQFSDWIAGIRDSSPSLDEKMYQELRKPSTEPAPLYFSRFEPGLFDNIVMQFMH
jgi:cytochrome o ubiquinol oxidase subunit 2